MAAELSGVHLQGLFLGNEGMPDLFVNISRTQEVPKNNGLISDGPHFGTVAQRNGKHVSGFQFEQLFSSILNVITVLVK